MNTVLIKDQTIGGDGINSINLEFENEIITVKDLIISRVQKEVEIYNSKAATPYAGLVIPDQVEKFLNSKTKTKRKEVDFEKQSYIALDGFITNQFFVIINDKQAEDLEEKVNLSIIKEVEFIKLTPLVGG